MATAASAQAPPLGQPTSCAPAVPGLYRQRRPEQTLYYKVVQQNLQTWLALRREAESDSDSEPIPAYVETAFLRFLGCGIYSCGFARLRCASCGHEALLPFSCRVRGGICPSCASKYTARSGAWLTDHVLPKVPFRQVVLTVPGARPLLPGPARPRALHSPHLPARPGVHYPGCVPLCPARRSHRCRDVHSHSGRQPQQTPALPFNSNRRQL